MNHQQNYQEIMYKKFYRNIIIPILNNKNIFKAFSFVFEI